jgi:BirA family biotin operon repressor/biotin-[acetyl-CoA-carboxylase] ligase
MSLWPDTYGRLVLAEVTSTSDEAMRRAGEGAGPFWLMAHRQTAARGRRGRPWTMAEGNFAATLILPMADPPALRAMRSFVMSLALFRAFGEVTGRQGDFGLKWPNDVLLKGGKVAGILLETSGSGPLAIGVGVNLVAAPAVASLEAGAVRPVSLSGETGVRVAPEVFLDVLARQFAGLEERFRHEGFSGLRTEWLAHATRLGEVVTARTVRDETTGIFEDVDAQGNLVLRTEAGRQAIAAADVYF